MGIMDMINPNQKDTHKVAPIPERLKKNQKVLIITGDNVEDTEFFYPYYRLTEEGYEVDVATENGGSFEGKHGLGLKESRTVDEINAADYALLYLPGGKAPASLRENEEVLEIVRAFQKANKPIAAICHGPQILAAADVIKGKRIAGWPEIQSELEDAGAIFVDEALVIDGQFITARMPGDLHRHLYGVLEYLKGNKTKAAA